MGQSISQYDKKNENGNQLDFYEVKEHVFFRSIFDFYFNAKLTGISNFPTNLKVNKLAL